MRAHFLVRHYDDLECEYGTPTLVSVEVKQISGQRVLIEQNGVQAWVDMADMRFSGPDAQWVQ